MKFAAAAAALVALVAAGPARADMHIRHDRGGRIDAYLSRYAVVRQSGQRVIVDGPCMSACTVLLGAIPKDRICVTRRASFVFHAAWVPAAHGAHAASALGDRMLWANYPSPVRAWITSHGGLTNRLIYLRGSELTAMYPSCESPPPSLRGATEARVRNPHPSSEPTEAGPAGFAQPTLRVGVFER
jgi:hypothetical protein